MSEPLTPSVWLAADGERVQFHHVCQGEPKVDTLPNSVWPVPADGNVKPSIHCTACGFHEFLTLVPRPALMDAIESERPSRPTPDTLDVERLSWALTNSRAFPWMDDKTVWAERIAREYAALADLAATREETP